MNKLYSPLRNGFFALITLGVMALTSPAQAIPLNFNFSFENTVNGGGTVTGIIRGLATDFAGAASSVEVLSNTNPLGAFGIGEYVGSPTNNLFTVGSGTITGFNFLSFGQLNTAPAVTDSTFSLVDSTSAPNGKFQIGLKKAPNATNVAQIPVTFTVSPVSAVPLPPTGILFATGLIGLAALRRRAKKRAEA